MQSNKVIYIILIFSFLINVLSIIHKTQTYDEWFHISYGMRILDGNSDRVGIYDDSKMPISVLNAIPFKINQIVTGKRYSYFKWQELSPILLFISRAITVVFSLVISLFVFRWSSELYGYFGGVISILIFVLSPNIIAHSRLATTDIYVTGMMLISYYYFWKMMRDVNLVSVIKSSSALGIALLTKYTSVFLVLIMILILVIKGCHYVYRLISKKTVTVSQKIIVKGLLLSIIYIFITVIIINTGFLANCTFTGMEKYRFRSQLFKTVQDMHVINKLIVPLPYPYLQGLDWVKYRESTGEQCGNIYLNGKLHAKEHGLHGFKGYFFYAILYKQPISILIIIILSFFVLIIRKKSNTFWKNEGFIILPVLFFLIYFNYFFNAQFGIRFIIVILPFLHIICGITGKMWELFSPSIRRIVIILFIYLIVSVLSYFPHYISYFNEIVYDRKMAYKYLSDSNIDWGQNIWYLKQYISKYPYSIFMPDSPTAGRIIVGANYLTGVVEPQKYRWLRDNFIPQGHIAYSYLIFNITSNQLQQVLHKR